MSQSVSVESFFLCSRELSVAYKQENGHANAQLVIAHGAIHLPTCRVSIYANSP